MTGEIAYISVGSNLGERADNCLQGIAALTATEAVNLLEQSRLFLTEPVNYEEQDWFVNGVIKIETSLSPSELLARLKGIEAAAGRKQGGVRFGPRVLDLDIIFYGSLVLDSDILTIPHPRLCQRLFVLQPFCDIDPDVRHPVLGKSVRQLTDSLLAGIANVKKVVVYK